ncbi:MAG: hypothetical protein WCO86_13790 [Planctomycetota bacterium]
MGNGRARAQGPIHSALMEGGTQPRSEPGSNVGTQFGLTIIPWENIKQDQRFELEGGFGMGSSLFLGIDCS